LKNILKKVVLKDRIFVLHRIINEVIMKKYIVSLCFLVLFMPGYVHADCISGNCKNGQGIMTYANGDKYDGQFKDGKKHGQGTLTFANGHKYIGQFKDDAMHGQGTITYADGEKYDGQWKDDRLHGEGTYTWPNGDKYVGQFKDGRMHGQGTLTFANGNKYVGHWEDGRRHGKGTLYDANGTIIHEGWWKNDEYVGSYMEYIKDRIKNFSGFGGSNPVGGSNPPPRAK
jgi:hypothetical protein